MRIGALADASPDDTDLLLVESDELIAGRHRQRLHLVVTAMRRFAVEQRRRGYEVDLRRASTMTDGLRQHLQGRGEREVVATAPNSRAARRWCERRNIRMVPSNQFLCPHDAFDGWADQRTTVRLEDFYRWHRSRLGYLMDGEQPVGGRWNLDAENRQPPPDEASMFTVPPRTRLDDLDREVLAGLPTSHGADPDGTWATTRRGALARLTHFVDEVLPLFGPYEDAMTTRSWNLGHSLLSPYLNLGLLMPDEVCDAVATAFDEGRVPLQSAEGVIRQIVGWREFVWGLYWRWPDHVDANALGHLRQLPPMFTGETATEMRCVADALAGLHNRAWIHHIQRLMVLANFANLYGTHPRRVMSWMTDQYIDAAEWVMVPNVMGMAMWADGGRMATKPYISGGAYINRMSDYCGDCRYRPSARVGDDACPFTTLYWDFLATHEEALSRSHRMAPQLRNRDRLDDLDQVREHAVQLRRRIRAGNC